MAHASRCGTPTEDWFTAGSRRLCYAAFMSVLRLIQFTDPHLYGSETETLRGIATLPALEAALALVRA